MIITNGKVFQEDGSYKVMDLYVENGRLVSSPEEVTDKHSLMQQGLKFFRDWWISTATVRRDMISQMQTLAD